MTKKSFRKNAEKIFENFFSISLRDVLFFSLLCVLTYISIDNNIKIKKFTESPGLEKETEITKETEEKGLTFLIMKEEPKNYNLKGLIKRYPKSEPYIPYINKAVEKYQNIWPIDNLTLFTKIRYESEFNQFAVSPKCALGPCQLMSYTAKELGLKVPKELEPDYFYKARFLDRIASTYHNLAIDAFWREQDDLAKYYRSISKKNRKEAEALYLKCKKNIKKWLKGKTYEDLKETPFDIEAAINAGAQHLAFCFKARKGDFRESFCAYNAGLGPVKKTNGIPYIKESVIFQNRAVNFYKYWSQMLETKNIEDKKLPKP